MEPLQKKYAPKSICFGCGPANQKGLKIESIPHLNEDGSTELRATWTPESYHEAFPGMLNGGIIGALLDCHSNWMASYHLMREGGLSEPPCTVTADFHVSLKRPTPTNGPVYLRAWVSESKGDRAVIDATLEAGGKVCATCRGTFVAVKAGHPAFHRW
jgi:acyl-coenzyme A thioesterase PaaI-like protein